MNSNFAFYLFDSMNAHSFKCLVTASLIKDGYSNAVRENQFI